MYQSPVAAIAELISNSWDADATEVEVTIPCNSIDDSSTIVISDNGIGMTFDECQNRFLNVGYARRGEDACEKSPTYGRPILGRKGIGKFAGFGIAELVRVETTSRNSGERTVFEMDLEQLRANEYVGDGSDNVDVIDYTPPRTTPRKRRVRQKSGTTITLKNLTISRRPSPVEFRKSMARRFLLHKRVDNFDILVNDVKIPDDDQYTKVEYSFPDDYPEGDRPDGLVIENGWGIEKLPDDGPLIRWRIVFYEDPIGEEELRGISVFAHQKLAQAPFLFNLTGGIAGQLGQEYISGQVEADYLDEQSEDVIAPERQRVNWQQEPCRPLLSWGQQRVKKLLQVWKSLRSTEKLKLLKGKLDRFQGRLDRLQRHERKTVETALKKLASISSLKNDDFVALAGSVLTAWESGRLRELIADVADSRDMDEETLLSLLMEMNVLTALHTAEAVKGKLEVLANLNERIRNRELENPLRDYIADNPWLIDAKWETFAKETRLKNVLGKAAREAELHKEEDWNKRVDLVLSSGNTLLVVEFMRPGPSIDRDHLDRFELYADSIVAQIQANSALEFNTVVGYLVADNLVKKPTNAKKLKKLEADQLYAMDWNTLLTRAAANWKEFLIVLIERAPQDSRLRELAAELDLDDTNRV
ncbi:MAG: hypothetical protein Fues2KO_14360 [Fuerstiella sp.]